MDHRSVQNCSMASPSHRSHNPQQSFHASHAALLLGSAKELLVAEELSHNIWIPEMFVS